MPATVVTIAINYFKRKDVPSQPEALRAGLRSSRSHSHTNAMSNLKPRENAFMQDKASARFHFKLSLLAAVAEGGCGRCASIPLWQH
jgi:hypothetical protein